MEPQISAGGPGCLDEQMCSAGICQQLDGGLQTE